MAAIQNDMRRLLGVLHEGNGPAERAWVPALDVWETESEYVYAFDLPGIPEDRISIEFEDGALTVTAERARTEQTGNDRFYRFERRFGCFTRTLGLPQGMASGRAARRAAPQPFLLLPAAGHRRFGHLSDVVDRPHPRSAPAAISGEPERERARREYTQASDTSYRSLRYMSRAF
jgi:HSP20 family molecular chaperone IbpA